MGKQKNRDILLAILAVITGTAILGSIASGIYFAATGFRLFNEAVNATEQMMVYGYSVTSHIMYGAFRIVVGICLVSTAISGSRKIYNELRRGVENG